MDSKFLEISITSDPKNLKILRSMVYNFSKRNGFPRRECDELVLAVNEAVANIIRHTYKNAPDKPIKMSCAMLSDRLKIVLRDFGNRVNPEDIKPRKLEDTKPGGLGVHFIRSTMDEVVYDDSVKNGNQLIMTKYLPQKKEDDDKR